MTKNQVAVFRETKTDNNENLSEVWDELDKVSTISCDFKQKTVVKPFQAGSWEMSPVSSSSKTQSDFQTHAFYKGIYPVILPLKVIGLYSVKPTPGSKSGWKRNPRLIYSAIIIILTFLFFVKSVIVFKSSEPFGELLFFKLTQTIWYFECFIKACVTVKAWYHRDRLAEFFQRWRAVCGDAPPKSSVRKFAIITTTIATGFVLMNAFGCAYVFFNVPGMEDILLTASEPFQLTESNQVALKCLVVVMLTVESAVAMFPIVLLIVLLFALYGQFKEVAAVISKSVDRTEEFGDKVEEIRCYHQKLCKLVDILDNCCNVVVACAYMSNIPNLCLMLYSILYFTEHLSMIILNLFWFLFLLIHMTTVSFFGAWLNSAAHAPLSDIYSVKSDALSSQNQFEINMLLSKLNGGTIGITAMRMFTINRPTILTVVGLLLTYFALLVQFKNTALAPCVCKSPSLLNDSYENP